MSLNGGYAMIKYNSTQEELQIAYRSKKPALFYDENQRAHWAVIEETATQSVDEETQEPITLYEYSYRLLDEESGGKLYLHKIIVKKNTLNHTSGSTIGTNVYLLYSIVTSSNEPITFDTFMNITHFDDYGPQFGTNVIGNITIKDVMRALHSFNSYSINNNRAEISYIDDGAVLKYTSCKFESIDGISDTITEV